MKKFKTISITEKFVQIRFNSDFLRFPVKVFEIARTQKNRSTRIRKPVHIIVDGHLFIFKKNQWDKAKLRAQEHLEFCREIHIWESTRRFKKNGKRIIPVMSTQ